MRKFKEEILSRGLWTIRILFVVTLTPAGPTHHSWLAAAAQYSATRPLTCQYTQNRAVYRTWTSAQLVSRQSQVATESSPLLGFSRTQSLLTASLADLQTKSCWILIQVSVSLVRNFMIRTPAPAHATHVVLWTINFGKWYE